MHHLPGRWVHSPSQKLPGLCCFTVLILVSLHKHDRLNPWLLVVEHSLQHCFFPQWGSEGSGCLHRQATSPFAGDTHSCLLFGHWFIQIALLSDLWALNLSGCLDLPPVCVTISFFCSSSLCWHTGQSNP